MHSANSDPPNVNDVSGWANQFSVNHPVLADSTGASYPLITGGYPSYVLVDQNMTIHIKDLYPFNPNTAASLITE